MNGKEEAQCPATRVLVVGGGVAGLATAHHLAQDTRWTRTKPLHITLVEKKGRYGGRVKTITVSRAPFSSSSSSSSSSSDDGDGGGDRDSETKSHKRSQSNTPTAHSPSGSEWYEAGASRIAETHHRVRALGRQVGCTEIKLPESYDQRAVMPELHTRFQQVHGEFVRSHGEAALKSVCWWDVLTIMCSAAERDSLVQKWGFLSVLKEMNAHDFWRYAMPQYLASTYYTYDGGLQRLTDALVQGLHKLDNVTLKPSTQLLRLDWQPTGKQRSGFVVTLQDDRCTSIYTATDHTLNTDSHHSAASCQSQQPYTEFYDIVFLALPAEALAGVQGLPERYAHFWSSVSRNRLIRCYARYPQLRTSTTAACAATRTPTRTPTRTATTANAVGGGKTKTGQHQQQISSHHNGTRSRRRGRAAAATTAPPVTRKSRHSSGQRRHTTTSTTSQHRPVLDDTRLCRHRVKSSILNKCTTTHAPEWRQISYCDHTNADHIYNTLRMPTGMKYFRKVVRSAVGAEWTRFSDSDFDVHYWKAGTHSWKPQLLADAHYDRVLQPDAKIPLFVIGASFSRYQHWMEGALETADDALKRCWRYAVEWMGMGSLRRRHQQGHHSQSATPTITPPFFLHSACQQPNRQHTMATVERNRWVVLDGYVYDVKPFVDRHPGGRALLDSVLGTDISTTYHRIGHSSVARAWAEEHCKGVLKML